jgi:alkanesulfonate monooxygenase SsuD/methylene tetrahydromethanopterin reductase-like flavin-dependent oxidoreductase (luciferase family)
VAVVTLRYDLREPDFARRALADRYATCLDQCAFAEERGIGMVAISEHHGVDDGYLPSPLVLAAAIAARTRQMSISISALLVTLHDPLRLAEDLAVLDLVSRGRVSAVAGLGYRDEEFAMFGVDRGRRGKILDESLEALLRAWTGEPFDYRGRTVRVTPRPFTQPHPVLLVGGSTEAAARRAARHRLGFMPAVGDPSLKDLYRAACAEVGFDQGFVVLPSGPGFVHVTDDPERAWAEIAPFALHEAKSYAGWQRDGQRSNVTTYATTVQELADSGIYWVVTPDECVERAAALRASAALTLHPLMGGMDPELGWGSLELFVDKVLPQLRST